LLTEHRKLRSGTPLWSERPIPHVPTAPLTGDIETEVLVIGAGVTGALVAEMLSAHREVAIIDRRGAAIGSTAASTALVSYEIDTPLTALAAMVGEERAARAWRRTHAAVLALSARTRELTIPCGFAYRPSLYLAGPVLAGEALHAEASARLKAGLAVEYLSGDELGRRYSIRRDGAILASGDFVVDPRQFAAGYLLAAQSHGARLFAPVEAAGVVAANGHIEVATAAGPTVTANHVVYCTGYELPAVLAGRGHRRVSTYAIATAPQARKLPALACMISEAADPYLYLREGPHGRIICGGEDEPVTEASARDALIPAKVDAIRAKLAALLPDADTTPEFAWAGTFGESETGLPSIGPLPGLPRAWAVLGFGGNGMVHARIAAEIITAALTGRTDRDAELYATL
jgi:glycine/D-amino acid oxidase-like deaminating enzyme